MCEFLREKLLIGAYWYHCFLHTKSQANQAKVNAKSMIFNFSIKCVQNPIEKLHRMTSLSLLLGVADKLEI